MLKTEIRPVRLVAAVLLASVLLPIAAAASPAALITQVEGAVTVEATDGSRPARALLVLDAGSRLRLATGSRAVVLCPGDRAVRLTGPTTWQPDAGSCATGQALPPGTYQLMLPPGSRVVEFHGSLLAQAPSRADDDSGRPQLLAPRSPQRSAVQIADAAPTLRWAEVPGCQAYVLVLERGGRELPHRVDAGSVPCSPDPRSAPVRGCEVPWPWPPLVEGEEVSLWVESSLPGNAWSQRQSDPSRLRLAPATVRHSVTTRVAALEADGLDEASRQLLAAAVYSDHQLFNEAAAALAASLAARPQPATAVRLADLYLGLGAQRAALNHYSQAQAMLSGNSSELELSAAVEHGLGRLHARSQDPVLAARHLRRAARLYRLLGWDAEAAAASAEAERAERGVL